MARKRSKKAPGYPSPEGAHVRFGADYLRQRLALLRGVIPRRAIMPACQSYHFEVLPDGRAFVGASDLERRLRLNLDVLHVLGSGRFILDAHALDALLGSYVAPTIEFSLDSKAEEMLATGHRVRATVPGYDAEANDLPIEGSLSTTGWLIRGDDLADALEKTRFATDPESSRYALGCILLEFPEPGDSTLTMVATDGRRLARLRVPVRRHGDNPATHYRPPAEGNDPYNGMARIDHKAIPLAMKLARAAGSYDVALAVIPGVPEDLEKRVYTRGSLQVVTRDAVLTTREQEGRFPRYQGIYAGFGTEELKARIAVDSAVLLLDFVESACAATDTESRATELVMAEGTLWMSVGSATKGKREMFVSVQHHEGRATVDIDPHYLWDFLRAAGTLPVELRCFGPDKAMWLVAGRSYDFVVMPLTRNKPPEPAASTPACIHCGAPGSVHEDDDVVRCYDCWSRKVAETQPPDDGGNVATEPDTPPEPEPEPVAAAPVVATKRGGHKSNVQARKAPPPKKGKGPKRPKK